MQCLAHPDSQLFLRGSFSSATFTLPDADLRGDVFENTESPGLLRAEGSGTPREPLCSQAMVPLSCDGERFKLSASVPSYTFLAEYWLQQVWRVTCHSQTQWLNADF